MSEGPWWRRDGQRVVLELHVQPRAGRTGIAGVHSGRLRVRVAAAPVEDAANRELVAFLAKQFRVPRARVTLLSGAAARDKRVAVEAPRRLPEWLSRAPAGCG